MHYDSKWIFVITAALLLGACGGGVRNNAPAPVISSGEAGAAGSAGAQVQAYRPPQQQVAIARPQPARAVQVLLRRAEDQQRAGDYAAAAASLERGLRIEPRNAQLWNRLAHVHSAQREYARVEQFAAKSNALAGSDDGLRADNWQLIAQARAARGDRRGAEQARAKARVVR